MSALPLLTRWVCIVPQTAIPYKNKILAAVPADDFEKFFSDLHPVSLSLRQQLHASGSSPAYVYFIEEGVASILVVMADGTAIEVGMVGTEGMIGVAALFGDDIADQQVIVQVPGTAHRLDADLCRTAFNGSAALRTVALRFTAGLMALSAQTAACNQLHTVEQRFARWLLMAHDRMNADVIPMTHEFLASMLGVRRTGITEIAARLRRSGLIHYRQGEIAILNFDAFRNTACECYQLDRRRLLNLL